MKRHAAGMVLLMCSLASCSSEKPASPAPVETLTKTGTANSVDGVEIEYEVHGDGPVALVLIHGWMGDRNYWREQIETFAADHTVVTLDLAGHGDSGGGREEWTFDRFAADVQAVVEALDLPRVILVGHSIGGTIALAVAARMPDRVLGVVGAEALHNVEVPILDPQQVEPVMGQYEKDFAGTCNRLIESMFPEPPAETGLREWVHETMCDADPATAIAVGRQMVTLDQAAMLASADVPVRCINSAKIALTDIEANRRHGNFDARLVEVGHFVMLERPEEFNRLLSEAIEELTGA